MSTTTGSDFYAAFQKRRNDLIERISSCEESQASNDETLKQITLDIQQLRKDTVEATSYLPAYDRKTCENQLADLESRIQKLRQRSKTKGKFLFKKSTPTPVKGQKKAPDSELVAQEQATAVTGTPPPISRAQTRRNEYITAATFAGDSELTLTDLDGCTVDFLERPTSSGARLPPNRTSLHIKDVRNSALVLGKVDGSVMLHNLERCTIVLKCHQLRIHNSKNLIICVEVPSDSSAVIEGCSGLTFANIPRDFWPVLPAETDEVPLTRPVIQDFSHIMSSTSPNWRYVEGDEAARCKALKGHLSDQKATSTAQQVILEELLPIST